jgi:hypothetical protein
MNNTSHSIITDQKRPTEWPGNGPIIDAWRTFSVIEKKDWGSVCTPLPPRIMDVWVQTRHSWTLVDSDVKMSKTDHNAGLLLRNGTFYESGGLTRQYGGQSSLRIWDKKTGKVRVQRCARVCAEELHATLRSGLSVCNVALGFVWRYCLQRCARVVRRNCMELDERGEGGSDR